MRTTACSPVDTPCSRLHTTYDLLCNDELVLTLPVKRNRAALSNDDEAICFLHVSAMFQWTQVRNLFLHRRRRCHYAYPPCVGAYSVYCSLGQCHCFNRISSVTIPAAGYASHWMVSRPLMETARSLASRSLMCMPKVQGWLSWVPWRL